MWSLSYFTPSSLKINDFQMEIEHWLLNWVWPNRMISSAGNSLSLLLRHLISQWGLVNLLCNVYHRLQLRSGLMAALLNCSSQLESCDKVIPSHRFSLTYVWLNWSTWSLFSPTMMLERPIVYINRLIFTFPTCLLLMMLILGKPRCPMFKICFISLRMFRPAD